MSEIEILSKKIDEMKCEMKNNNITIKNFISKNQKLNNDLKELENNYKKILEEEQKNNHINKLLSYDKNNEETKKVVYIKLTFDLKYEGDNHYSILDKCETYNNIKDAMGDFMNWKKPDISMDIDDFPIQKDVVLCRYEGLYSTLMILKKKI
jgi:vacuolar-type H+-ATPase catalytic subunit A/Vma1